LRYHSTLIFFAPLQYDNPERTARRFSRELNGEREKNESDGSDRSDQSDKQDELSESDELDEPGETSCSQA
jgi:hypothetical protein